VFFHVEQCKNLFSYVPFKEIFPFRLLVAPFSAALAAIIVVLRSILRGTAHCNHTLPADTAFKPPCEIIFNFCLGSCRGFFCVLEESLDFVVDVMAYKCRTAVFNGNIRSVGKCTYIFRVSQHIVKRIYLELSACSGVESAPVKFLCNSLLSLTICVHGKGNTRYVCCGFIDFKVLIFSPFVAKRRF